ncbi:MAG: cell division protein FtsA [Dehalococcoidia bacterium]
MKGNRIAAIDVGTTKVCTIMADVDGSGGLRILGVGVAPTQGLHKGLVVEVKDATESIHQSVRKAEQMAGYRLKAACVGITGRHISSANSYGVVTISRKDRLVRPRDLRRVLEVAQNAKVPGDRKLLHIIPRTYAVDKREGVKNPVGLHGFRLDVEAHIITAAAASVRNLTKCIRGIGIDIDDLILEPLASSEAILREEEKQNGVMLADIGGGTTDIAIFKEGSICHTAVLPIAGYQITNDIAIGLGLSFELAEEMKKRYGNIIPPEEGDNGHQTVVEDEHSVSYQDLCEIIRIRVEEILRLIILELPHTDYLQSVPSGLVLTGGSANLPGIAQVGHEVTGLPVRIGAPIDLAGVSDTLYNPAYATSVGLLLWKIRGKDSQKWLSKGGGVHRLISQILKLFRL